MNLIPNAWSCLPTAVANVIGVPVDKFIERIGHDGSGTPFDPPFQDAKAGFHLQECVDVLHYLGYWGSVIDLRPHIKPEMSATPHPVKCRHSPRERLACHMAGTDGVVCGYRPSGIGHAVGWVGGLVIDPSYPMVYRLAQDLLYKKLEPLCYLKIGKYA